jgi:carbamoyl-phosphate synthase/aspartate carbamoyltransferase/dihydroorotase
LYNRPLHIAHVSLKEELEVIRAAKQRGINVTCEVCPHHLFLNAEEAHLSCGRKEVRPRLATRIDQEALWANMDIIDVIATDHAPHTLDEKDGDKPPPGYPGLETALALMLTAVNKGRISLADLIAKMYTNPRRIFNLPEQNDTYVVVDLDEQWTIPGKMKYSKCGWTPFAGMKVQGRVRRVVLRGEVAMLDGKVYAPPGSGRNVCDSRIRAPLKPSAPIAPITPIGTKLEKPSIPTPATTPSTSTPTPLFMKPSSIPPLKGVEGGRLSLPLPLPAEVARPMPVTTSSWAATTPVTSSVAVSTSTNILTPSPLSYASPRLSTSVSSPSIGEMGQIGGIGGGGVGQLSPVLPRARERAKKEKQDARGNLISHAENLPRFTAKHVISVKQFTRDNLRYLFSVAHDMRMMVKRVGCLDLLKGKVLANAFYEPSTRTSSSFAAAMTRLGGSVISINDTASSVAKGESLPDTVRTLECYADIIVLRHPLAGSAQLAASHARVPIINAGDGIGEHPTQALLDVFTIREELGTVNGLRVTLVGDLKHGRTVHSLVHLLCLYNLAQLSYVSPPSLRMPRSIVEEVERKGIPQREYEDLAEVLPSTDVLYVTRIQKERFESLEEYNKVKGSYVITPESLSHAKDTLVVMHPLPRVDEISPQLDSDPRAAYFRQMENGMYIRMALLATVLDNKGALHSQLS